MSFKKIKAFYAVPFFSSFFFLSQIYIFQLESKNELRTIVCIQWKDENNVANF